MHGKVKPIDRNSYLYWLRLFLVVTEQSQFSNEHFFFLSLSLLQANESIPKWSTGIRSGPSIRLRKSCATDIESCSAKSEKAIAWKRTTIGPQTKRELTKKIPIKIQVYPDYDWDVRCHNRIRIHHKPTNRTNAVIIIVLQSSDRKIAKCVLLCGSLRNTTKPSRTRNLRNLLFLIHFEWDFSFS